MALTGEAEVRVGNVLDGALGEAVQAAGHAVDADEPRPGLPEALPLILVPIPLVNMMIVVSPF